MYIPRNPDGTLKHVHPFAPTFIIVCRNGRRIYDVREPFIRAYIAANLASVSGLFLVKCGRSVAIPIR